MSGNSKMRAWLSVVGSVIMTVCALAPFATVSLYMAEMTSALNASIGQVSAILSVATIGGIGGSLLIGPTMKKISPKIMVILGGIMVAIFQLTIGFSSSLILIYISSLLFGFGSVWGGIAMAQITITKWFAKGTGTLISVCTVATSLVMTIAIPFIGMYVAQVGYRSVVIAVGIITGLGIVVSGFLVSDDPSKYGMRPVGAEDTASDTSNRSAVEIAGLPWNKVRKAVSFWLIFLVVVLATIVAQGFSSQGAVIIGSFGLDPMQAALGLSIFTFTSMIVQFFWGIICDKLGGPKIASFIYCTISGLICLIAFVLAGWVGAVVFAIGMAFGGSIAGLFGPNAAPRLFGARDAGEMIGVLAFAGNIGAMLGPVVVGMMYDVLGTYKPIIFIMGVLLLVCLILSIVIYSKGNMNSVRKQMEAEK